MDLSPMNCKNLTAEGVSDLLLGKSPNYAKHVNRYHRSKQEHEDLLRQADHYERRSRDIDGSLNLPRTKFVKRFKCSERVEKMMDNVNFCCIGISCITSLFASLSLIGKCLQHLSPPPGPGAAMFFSFIGAFFLSAPIGVGLAKLCEWFTTDVVGRRLSYQDNKNMLITEKESVDNHASYFRGKAGRVEKRKNAQLALIGKQCADKKQPGDDKKQPDADKITHDDDQQEVSIRGVRLKVKQ